MNFPEIFSSCLIVANANLLPSVATKFNFFPIKSNSIPFKAYLVSSNDTANCLIFLLSFVHLFLF